MNDTHPQISDTRAVDLIAERLSGVEWDAEAASDVADIVRLTGRTMADLDGDEEDDE